MELWHAWICPYCIRVRIALAEKGIPYEEREVDLARKPKELFAVNPSGAVPVLVDGGAAIPESIVILQYLEDRFPERPLLPRDPLGRARARLLHDRITQSLAPHLFKLAKGTPEERPAAEAAVRAALEGLEKEAPEKGFLLGDFSIADVALASHLPRLPEALRPASLRLPRLARWEAAARDRPSVAVHTAPQRPARA